MSKLILFIIIIAAIYFLFFKKKEIPNDSNELIMCDKCKTFYPENEIKKIDGKNICKDCYANS